MKRCYVALLFLIIGLPFKIQAQNAPLEFIENRGQWDGPFAYKAVMGNGDVYLEKNAFTYVIGLPSNNDMMEAYKHGQIKTPPILKFHAYKMVFEGAKEPKIRGSKEQKYYNNYFLGKDPTKWKTGIHPYLALDYKGLYEGIDVHTASERGNLKYDFMVSPGSDVGQIRIKYEGADKLEIKDGHLLIKTSVGDVTEIQPYAYQYIDGEQKEVACRYKLKDNRVSFSLPNGYDQSQLLIIDPVVVFCTFTGSTADNWGFTATYDNQGNFYAGGLVNSTGYPVSPGAFQVTFAGGFTSGTFVDSTHGSDYACDIGIIKLNPSGNARIYATYIGGSDNEQPHSLIVDANDNLIIAARTYSGNYPVTAGVYDQTYNGGGDIAITKLNAAGTALVASTFLGGSKEDGINFNSLETVFGGLKHNYGDDARSEVLIDNAGNIYLTASTKSTNFPVTANATQSTFQGEQDAIVAKFDNTLSNLTWSTFLGGTDNDAGYVLALDNAQASLYVGGGTSSSNFPSTAGTLWTTYQGGAADGFLAKFQNSAPYTLQKMTFIGKNDYDQVYGIQVDIQDNVYIMGQTLGGTFPVTAGVYSNPGSSQFLMKLNPSLSTNLLSTVFGSGNSFQTDISPVAFLVDSCSNIYISGWGGDLDISSVPPTVGNTLGLPVTAGAAQPTTDGFDFYFIVFSPGATGLLYATFYGRSSNDAGKGEHVDGGTSRFDKSGVIYQAICGGCRGNPTIPTTPFPTTPGSWSPNNGFPTNCNEVALKIAFQLGNPNAQAIAGPATSGCPPLPVTFTNSSTNAVAYIWNFGDGSPTDTTSTPTHTFTTPGTFTVTLIANNPIGCNKTSDTTSFIITVDTNQIHAGFTSVVTDSCGPYRAAFTNTSKEGTPATNTQYTWSFGDNTTFNGKNPPLHNYPDTGCYTVRLIITDPLSCNKADTVEKLVCIHGFKLKAAFTAPDSICLNSGLLLANASVNAQTFLWQFGDGQTSTSMSPLHVYAASGSYTITLIAKNPNSCNKADTAVQTVRILTLPIADFIFAPIIPVANMPIQFTNKSQNAVTYQWGFGDGTGSTEVDPEHLYKKTGTYTVCLTARSVDGCLDTICKKVDAEIHPAVDVPTGFSPNGDGSNDILYVRGAAIETVNFKVFNRWGQLVFETTDMKKGWDGNFKGKPQEMDSYAWVLDVMFIDESTVHRTGNVTLLR